VLIVFVNGFIQPLYKSSTDINLTIGIGMIHMMTLPFKWSIKPSPVSVYVV